MSAALAPDELPPASTARLVRGAARAVEQAVRGSVEIDPWGLDPQWYDLWAGAARVMCAIRIEGAEHVPDGPSLVVTNARIGVGAPAVVAAAVQDITGSRLRWAGLPDVSLATTGRRLGAVLGVQSELSAVLRSGQPVGLMARRQLRPIGRVGPVDPDPVGSAVMLDAPVVPVAVSARIGGRRWSVRFGAPLDPPPHRNPLAVVEHAEAVRTAIQELLDG